MRLTSRPRIRDNPAPDAAPFARLVRRVEALEELGLELPLPLIDERSRREDQNAPSEAADAELLEDDPSLDGLPEPDFVGQERATAHVLERAQGDVDLVWQLLDGVRVERDQALEA